MRHWGHSWSPALRARATYSGAVAVSTVDIPQDWRRRECSFVPYASLHCPAVVTRKQVRPITRFEIRPGNSDLSAQRMPAALIKQSLRTPREPGHHSLSNTACVKLPRRYLRRDTTRDKEMTSDSPLVSRTLRFAVRRTKSFFCCCCFINNSTYGLS